jgi:hypothetical protein
MDLKMRTLYSLMLITLAVLYSIQVQAAPNLLLECLGKEETLFHKEKISGVLFRLNQEFINELATSNDITLKKRFVDEICQSKIHSPSVALLRLLLLKESEIYDLSFSEIDAGMRPFKMGYINEFQKQIPRLFIQYISGLQAELPTHDCLNKAIPELNLFNNHLKYLEEEMSTHDIIKDKNKIEIIFIRLQKINEIKKGCEAEALLQLKKLKKVKKKKSANL